MFTHWASGEESGDPIDLVLTVFGFWGPISIRLVCVQEIDVGVIVSLSCNVRLFWGDVQQFCTVLVGDLDLERVRFLDESLGIGRLPAT